MRRTLFTIGHSTHSLDRFIGLLKQYRITAICDVRSVPYSQFNPQFNREGLEKNLAAEHIAYVFLGKELGARSDNPSCYIEGKVQYNYLAEEPKFLNGLRRLKRGITLYQVALMCAERDPLTCHRTILVCREMRSSTFAIEHILADGTVETSAAAEKRLMRLTGFVPDMFHSEHDCIEKAYDKQASDIAYTIDSSTSEDNEDERA